MRFLRGSSGDGSPLEPDRPADGGGGGVATAEHPVTDSSVEPAGGLPMDPRLRARRIAVKREVGRRRLRHTFVLVVLVVLIAAAVAAVLSPPLRVRTVAISGASYSDVGRLRALAEQVRNDPMVFADLDGLRREVEAEPWVRRARVWRRWPDTVRVDIVERRPVLAFYGDDGRYRVVDTEGQVVAVLDGQPLDVLVVDGVGPAAEPGTVLADLVPLAELAWSLPDSLRLLVRDLVRTDSDEVGLRLVDGGVVLLGPPTDLRAKLVATLTVLGSLEDPTTIGTVDVRVPSQPVLTPRTS